MKAVFIGGAVLIIAGAFYFGGNPFHGVRAGEVYPLSADKVYDILAETNLPEDLGEVAYSYDGNGYSRDSEAGKWVNWTLKAKGYTIATYTATLEPVSQNETRVALKFEVSDQAPEGVDLSAINRGKAIAHIAEIIMNEQIDSRLDGRPYDKVKVRTSSMAYAFAHSSELRSEMDELNAEAESFDARHRSEYSSGSASSKPITGKPMIDTNPDSDN
jgi:hypothetical protein